MSQGPGRRFIDFLASTGLATTLLVVVGSWSVVATLITQGGPGNPKVLEWGRAHAVVEPIVRALGLHSAFTAPIFLAAALGLAVSTALCAWRRTKVARTKARLLAISANEGGASVAERHDFEVPISAAVTAEQALEAAASVLDEIGVPTKKHDGVISHVSSPWTVWGSPVFHWALLLLIVGIVGGQLLRSEGLLGLAVGQTKPDAAASYGTVHTGPLHDWSFVHRSIRLDGFEPDYVSDGVHRGPTPHVTVLDASGNVLKSQRVYPNMTLKTGNLSVYPADFGLSAAISLLNSKGQVTGSTFQLLDFSSETTEGTAPVGGINVTDSSGKTLLSIELTVPLDVDGKGLGAKRVPAHPSVRVQVFDGNDKRVLDRRASVGEAVDLPDGSRLRLDGVSYYARLQVVDDGSIPVLLGGLVIAMLGLALAVFVRQQVVLATVAEADGRRVLVVRLRLWRNPPSSRAEIERQLVAALGDPQHEIGS